jgi:hypothetical protein
MENLILKFKLMFKFKSKVYIYVLRKILNCKYQISRSILMFAAKVSSKICG